MYVKFISITLGGNVFKSKTLWRKKNEQCNLEQFFFFFLFCLTLFKEMVSVGTQTPGLVPECLELTVCLLSFSLIHPD